MIFRSSDRVDKMSTDMTCVCSHILVSQKPSSFPPGLVMESNLKVHFPLFSLPEIIISLVNDVFGCYINDFKVKLDYIIVAIPATSWGPPY